VGHIHDMVEEPMISEHIYIGMYVVSLISGTVAFFFYVEDFVRTKDLFIRRFISFHGTFSLMVFCAAIFAYINTNVVNGWLIDRLFVVVIIAGAGTLSYTMPQWFYEMTETKIPGRMKRLLVAIWLTPAVAIPLLLAINSVTVTFVSIGVVMFGFAIASTYCVILVVRNIRHVKSEIKRTALVAVLVVFPVQVILSYLDVRYMKDPNISYIVSLPLNFLILNILAVAFLFKYRAERNGSVASTVATLTSSFRLTKREGEITNLIVSGKSNKEIAYELSIDQSTVKNHIYRLYRKVGVSSRVQLVRIMAHL
jgi:DNA-binding CsgD family transcriptional regulator